MEVSRIEKKLNYATEMAKLQASPHEPSPELIVQFMLSLQIEELITLIKKQGVEMSEQIQAVKFDISSISSSVTNIEFKQD